ncbi:hypothetical protein PsalN5692_03890 (plasmid) [Piscirickettsia salmonis]|uniref:hypothetical protein n=4 Tax=Piscirickettsia salmonis TaxID=1238 RepID=UPI0012B9606D|nr:hypothetical protein [Piscirickettsia salmonis]QGP52381.1 hypothetical protein PsalN5692_03890 [Piscirickettsia salmonis]
MTKHIAAFFCGTGYTQESDASFQLLRSNCPAFVELHGYDGCDSQGKFLNLGGLNANGTGEPADDFVEKLREAMRAYDGERLKVNLIAHSRGCLSALKAAQRIQADPELRDCVDIVLDLREPVPGNLELGVRLGRKSLGTVTHKVSDLSQCDVVEKVHISLSEKVGNHSNKAGFNSLIPRFHPKTYVEVEALPTWHDEQEQLNGLVLHKGRDRWGAYEVHPVDSSIIERESLGVLTLGACKSEQIIHEGIDPFELGIDPDQHEEKIGELKAMQLRCYRELKRKVKAPRLEKARDTHFGGKVGVLNSDAAALNLRHYCLLPEADRGTRGVDFALGVYPPPKNLSCVQQLSLYPEGLNLLEMIIREQHSLKIESKIEQIEDDDLYESAVKYKHKLIESLAKKAVRCLAAEKPFNPKNYQAQKQLKIFSQLLGDPEEGQEQRAQREQQLKDRMLLEDLKSDLLAKSEISDVKAECFLRAATFQDVCYVAVKQQKWSPKSTTSSGRNMCTILNTEQKYEKFSALIRADDGKVHFRNLRRCAGGYFQGDARDKHYKELFSHSKGESALMFLESYFRLQNRSHPAQYPRARVTIEP